MLNDCHIMQPTRNCLLLQDQWELSLLVDGVLLTSLDGVPELSTLTRLVLHVWNKDNVVADLPDPLNPPSAVAYFRNLRCVFVLGYFGSFTI